MSRFQSITLDEAEQFVCESASPELVARVTEALERDEALRAYVEQRRQERHAFYGSRSFAPVRARIATDKSRPRLSLWWLAALAPVAAGVVLVVRPTSELSAIRTRGTLTTELTVKRDQRIFKYTEDTVLATGDRIRLKVQDPDGGYLYVLGLDGQGRVTPYHDGSTARVAAGSTLLPNSWELDNATIREVLVVVLSHEPVDMASLQSWLRDSAGERFPPKLQPTSGQRIAVIELRRDVL